MTMGSSVLRSQGHSDYHSEDCFCEDKPVLVHNVIKEEFGQSKDTSLNYDKRAKPSRFQILHSSEIKSSLLNMSKWCFISKLLFACLTDIVYCNYFF